RMKLRADLLARDLAALVAVPSVTGEERVALERLGELADRLGLQPALYRHDLHGLRAHPDYPGEETSRSELWGLSVTVPGAGAGGRPRLALAGHVDVVPAGSEAWRYGPWSGAIADGCVWGRGAVDMKGGVIAALHALAVAGPTASCEAVLLAVSSEEDGGLGTFAALERDAAFDACLIPEPVGFDAVCAHAGALTFQGVVHGVGAHAALRLQGASAIDRYLPIHAALAEHERRLNSDIEHPLMRDLELPYPVVVGRLHAGEWSSTVPDHLLFEGRVGVRVGESLADARRALEDAVAAAGDCAVELRWTGGQFAGADTPPDHPFATLVRDSLTAETGRQARFTAIPSGTDMRLFCARGIPCVMAGTPGLDLAHAVNERVRVDDVLTLAQVIARVIGEFPSPARP
ncbi:MAG TPA: M20/M25/M40 family metallo-hydrolase, partial [Solirubrobacteraceae bacterium]|nr:M20/M25/M40 family metallo-hydrolase [Solirubrobacteraceae bacterium]